MYRIAKTFRFEAAHSLPSLPPQHKCHNLHGHSYVVTIELQSETLDEHGFILDYGDLRDFAQLVSWLDHSNLNDKLPCATSAENLARWLFDCAAVYYGGLVSAVEVSESTSSWARYER